MKKLTKSVQEYISMRRQLGFKLTEVAHVLNNFAAYMESKKKTHILSKLALDFAMQNPSCSRFQWSVRLGIIRRFSIYLHAMDLRTEIPAPDLLTCAYHRKHPYIYSDDDIVKLLNSCKSLPSNNPLRAQTYYILFGLIAVTGMRTSEALALSPKSIDLKNGIITICESKFRKSRKIPIHESTIKKLARYAKARDQLYGKQSPYFFVNNKGDGLSGSIVRGVFIKVCIAAGLRKKGESRGPRIIDFRHSAAVKILSRCYQEGLNVDVVIPALSVYLGHENPLNTYWYLTATPELLRVINDHLEKKVGGM